MSTVVLTAADRCDRCGAQAYVLLSVFVMDTGNCELLLCAHHYRRHESRLADSGARVVLDQRRQLQGQQSPA